MKTTKKKVVRKKNLSAKTPNQYVFNTNGNRFTLTGTKLSDSFRSVRLSDLRAADNLGTVTVRSKYKGDSIVYRDELGVMLGSTTVAIGCQEFVGVNATKILKRARITL